MLRYFCRILAGTRQPSSIAIMGRGSLGGGAFTAGTGGPAALLGTGRRKALFPGKAALCSVVGCCWLVGNPKPAGRPGETVAGAAALGLEVSIPITLGTWAMRFFSAPPDDDEGDGRGAAIRCEVDESCGQDCSPLAALASWKLLKRSIIIMPGVRRAGLARTRLDGRTGAST